MSENRHKNIHFLMCDSVQDISHFICSLCYLFLLVVCDKHNRFKMTKSFFQTVPPCESFLSNHKLTQIRNIQYCLSYLGGTILTTFSGVQAQNLRSPEKEHSFLQYHGQQCFLCGFKFLFSIQIVSIKLDIIIFIALSIHQPLNPEQNAHGFYNQKK